MKEFTDDDLTAIARQAALDSTHRYSYMPAMPEEAAQWVPHRWVIEAMRAILAAPAVERQEPVACNHEWTDDGEFTLICTKCGKEENHEPYGWVQTRGDSINYFTQEWDVVQEWEESGYEYKAMFDHTSPPAPVAVSEIEAIRERHEAWMAGVENGKASVDPSIDENAEFDKWRNTQIDVLVRNGYPEGAEAFRNLGSVQWAGWQARACLDKVKELNQ